MFIATYRITQEQYRHAVAILKKHDGKRTTGCTATECHIQKCYTLGSNITGKELRQKGLSLPTFKNIFDIMLQAHKTISHQRIITKNKADI
mmetsp:Transcript_17077/g.24344  ORF Transcript_17077/g.24344 Transcript_17077/m.24344 type:complete len:91 (+) Transcript_17077:39-311(+)